MHSDLERELIQVVRTVEQLQRKYLDLLLGEEAGTRVVSCHLGAGCSLAASVTGEAGARDTTMGFSPLSGLMMGTRSGDIDPGVVTYMADRSGTPLILTRYSIILT